jgi:hypothetical protein
LRVALEPVLRDLRVASVAPSRIEDSTWPVDDYVGAMVWSVDGSGQGISVARSSPVVERIASVAEQVQQWAIEQLWSEGRSTNWPRYPLHPGSHPLRATVRAGSAWWAYRGRRSTRRRSGGYGVVDQVGPGG